MDAAIQFFFDIVAFREVFTVSGRCLVWRHKSVSFILLVRTHRPHC